MGNMLLSALVYGASETPECIPSGPADSAISRIWPSLSKHSTGSEVSLIWSADRIFGIVSCSL